MIKLLNILKDNLSRQVAKDIERSSMQKDLLDYKQKVIQEMEENNRKKIKKVLDTLKYRYRK